MQSILILRVEHALKRVNPKFQSNNFVSPSLPELPVTTAGNVSDILQSQPELPIKRPEALLIVGPQLVGEVRLWVSKLSSPLEHYPGALAILRVITDNINISVSNVHCCFGDAFLAESR